jgi:hypothetical protein
MAELAIILAAVGGVAGTAIGAGGAIAQGEAQAQQAEANAQAAEENAKLQIQNAKMQEKITDIQVAAQNAETNAAVDAVRRNNAAIMAQNRAEAGSMGIDITGSPMMLAIDNAENAELEALETQRAGRNKAIALQYEGDIQTYNFLQAARQSLMEKQNYNTQKQYIRTSTVFNAIGGGAQGAVTGAKAGYSAGGAL